VLVPIFLVLTHQQRDSDVFYELTLPADSPEKPFFSMRISRQRHRTDPQRGEAVLAADCNEYKGDMKR